MEIELGRRDFSLAEQRFLIASEQVNGHERARRQMPTTKQVAGLHHVVERRSHRRVLVDFVHFQNGLRGHDMSCKGIG